MSRSQTLPTTTTTTRRVLHVEVQFSQEFRSFDFNDPSWNINQFIHTHLKQNYSAVYTNQTLFIKSDDDDDQEKPVFDEDDEIDQLTEMIEMIYIAEYQDDKPQERDSQRASDDGPRDSSMMLSLENNNLEVKVYAYTLCNESEDTTTTTTSHKRPVIISDSSGDDDSDDIPMPEIHFIPLPNRQLNGLWQSLVFDHNIKPQLISYVRTLDCFSSMIHSNIKRPAINSLINFNRIILLYGLPGTGKTSLCKSLCQQIAIRMQKNNSSATYLTGYRNFRLVEIPCHSLISKWFGQSSTIISKYFDRIEAELRAARESLYVFILFDEIESLLNSREASAHNHDPSDIIRIVNTILIRLDRLSNVIKGLNNTTKRKCNFTVLATSNLLQLIDSAFLDRVDFRAFIGPPGIESIYWIIASCLNELLSCDILIYDDHNVAELLPYRYAIYSNETSVESALLSVSKKCESHGSSPRFLTKLCMLTHSRYLLRHPLEYESLESDLVDLSSPKTDIACFYIPLKRFLTCMEKVVTEHYSIQ